MLTSTPRPLPTSARKRTALRRLREAKRRPGWHLADADTRLVLALTFLVGQVDDQVDGPPRLNDGDLAVIAAALEDPAIVQIARNLLRKAGAL